MKVWDKQKADRETRVQAGSRHATTMIALAAIKALSHHVGGIDRGHIDVPEQAPHQGAGSRSVSTSRIAVSLEGLHIAPVAINLLNLCLGS